MTTELSSINPKLPKIPFSAIEANLVRETKLENETAKKKPKTLQKTKKLSKTKELSIRADVINKTVLRMVKQFLAPIIESRRNANLGMISKIRNWVRENPDLEGEKDIMSLVFMIGAFANGIKMKKEMPYEDLSEDQTSEANSVCILVHSTTYKYTLSKMNTLLKMP